MIIAVDTGGTKTIVARFSDDGILLQSTKIPTPKPVDEYVATISENIRLVAAGENITMISMALPGVIHDGIAEWCVNLGWKNVPIRQLMANNFPNVDILIDNDANLAGLASMCRLDYSPKCGLYITIGTGIGTALVLNGELHDALLDCEGGHMLLEFKGKNVEWEDIASGRVFNEMFGTNIKVGFGSVWALKNKKLVDGVVDDNAVLPNETGNDNGNGGEGSASDTATDNGQENNADDNQAANTESNNDTDLNNGGGEDEQEQRQSDNQDSGNDSGDDYESEKTIEELQAVIDSPDSSDEDKQAATELLNELLNKE